MPIQNNFSHILEYCDVIKDAHGSKNDYRHVIIKGQHLLKKHFVTDLLLEQDKIERLFGRVLRCGKNQTHKNVVV